MVSPLHTEMESKRCSSTPVVTEKKIGILQRMRNYSLTSRSSDVESNDEDTGDQMRKHTGLKLNLREKLLSSGSSNNSSFDSDVFNLDTHKNLRVLMLGASQVGKTTIIKKFMHESTLELKETVQEMYSQDINISSTSGSTITMNIEDTGGNYAEDFPVMLDISLKNSDVVILVYSLDDESSFENITRIRDSILSRGFTPPMIIVGNKSDLARSANLPFTEIEATVCLDWEAGYVEVSAGEDSDVDTVFKETLVQARILPRSWSDNLQTKLTPSPSVKQTPFFKRMISKESLIRR